MSLRSRILLPVIISVLVAGIGTFFGVYFNIQNMVADQVADKRHSLERTMVEEVDAKVHEYDAFLNATGDRVLQQAALFSQLPDVQQAYGAALAGNINDEAAPGCQAARDMLRESMAVYSQGYMAQTGADNYRLHFHLKSGRSLMRLWRQGWQTKRDGKKIDISDDLT